MRDSQLKLLQDFTASAAKKKILDDFLNGLEKGPGVIKMVGLENAFILAAAALSDASSIEREFITGEEEEAHEILHIVLCEHEKNGIAGVKALRHKLGIQ